MGKRYVTIWLPYIKTDWYARRDPVLGKEPFVLYQTTRGKMMITAANRKAETKGIFTGNVLADSRAIYPPLEAKEDDSDFFTDLLLRFAKWCIRFSPWVAIHPPDGIVIDASGCTHLWGNEEKYVQDISTRLLHAGYHVKVAMASSIGCAWAMAHFAQTTTIIAAGKEQEALNPLPIQALRLPTELCDRLCKLGIVKIKNVLALPGTALQRRFGQELLLRLQQALGYVEEHVDFVFIIPPYQERLPCLDPIVTLAGIEIALKKLLDALCQRLQKEEKGIRNACLICHRIDGNIQQIDIGLTHPSRDEAHIFKLFTIKLSSIEPKLGIELFILESTRVEHFANTIQKIWSKKGDLLDDALLKLIDQIGNKIGSENIYRTVPDEFFIPEKSFKQATVLHEEMQTTWDATKMRPVKILSPPQKILVTAPIPDYPPILFRYKGKVHKIVKADGPERIEPAWWLQGGLHRDYYYVEDDEGHRYWLFRYGHYKSGTSDRWFLHGFCA